MFVQDEVFVLDKANEALVDKAVVWGECNQDKAVVQEEDNYEEANFPDKADQDNLSVVLAVEVEDNTIETAVVPAVEGRGAVVLVMEKEDGAIEAASSCPWRMFTHCWALFFWIVIQRKSQ